MRKRRKVGKRWDEEEEGQGVREGSDEEEEVQEVREG